MGGIDGASTLSVVTPTQSGRGIKAVRIRVTVKTNARENRVEQIGDDEYRVRVTASPTRGRANAAVLKLLAAYFGGQARIVSGATSPKKIIAIEPKPGGPRTPV